MSDLNMNALFINMFRNTSIKKYTLIGLLITLSGGVFAEADDRLPKVIDGMTYTSAVWDDPKDELNRKLKPARVSLEVACPAVEVPFLTGAIECKKTIIENEGTPEEKIEELAYFETIACLNPESKLTDGDYPDPNLCKNNPGLQYRDFDKPELYASKAAKKEYHQRYMTHLKQMHSCRWLEKSNVPASGKFDWRPKLFHVPVSCGGKRSGSVEVNVIAAKIDWRGNKIITKDDGKRYRRSTHASTHTVHKLRRSDQMVDAVDIWIDTGFLTGKRFGDAKWVEQIVDTGTPRTRGPGRTGTAASTHKPRDIDSIVAVSYERPQAPALVTPFH